MNQADGAAREDFAKVPKNLLRHEGRRGRRGES